MQNRSGRWPSDDKFVRTCLSSRRVSIIARVEASSYAGICGRRTPSITTVSCSMKMARNNRLVPESRRASCTVGLAMKVLMISSFDSERIPGMVVAKKRGPLRARCPLCCRSYTSATSHVEEASFIVILAQNVSARFERGPTTGIELRQMMRGRWICVVRLWETLSLRHDGSRSTRSP